MTDIGLGELDRTCALRELFFVLTTQEFIYKVAKDTIACNPGRHRFFIAIADPDRNLKSEA